MRDQTRMDRQMLSRKAWYRFFRALTLFIFIATALVVGMIGGLFASAARMLPKGEELADIHPPSPTRILAIDGTVLAKVYTENREEIAIGKMRYMPNATLAIEDIRFYEHPGVDPRGILRAFFKDIQAGDNKEGASTITQQLARNLYLNREKKLTRKLQEMILAMELEQRYSKQEILETYLNQVYYGSNPYGLQSYGVQTAAQNYFGKDPDQLTYAQSALLAGLPKNPSGYNPYRFPDVATGRRNQVLFNMWHYHLISAEDYQLAVDEPLNLIPAKKPVVMADWHAPYFVHYVLNTELPKIFGQDTNDYVYHYGIDIYTSLDPRMQKVGEKEVAEQVAANRARKIDDGALVSIDPQTGYIKAMVGGTDFSKNQFNVVTQGLRQPGSSFKTFVYTTALLHGYTPTTMVADRAAGYPSGSGGTWTPKNDDGRYLGSMELQKALWISRNAAAVGVAADIGIKNVIDIAHRMGIKSPLEPVLPTAIGASAVTPMEMCSGYGTLANHGVHNAPEAIVRVTTHDGNDLYDYTPSPERVIPTDVADTMRTVMRGVVERGTGMRARCPFPVSGKTGTTSSFHDAWFIGYTEDLVTAVWVGNRGNQPMNRTFGGDVPAPIFRSFMLVAQPIMADEHRKIKSELLSLNSKPEPTDLDRTPSDYALKHGGVAFGAPPDTPPSTPVDTTVTPNVSPHDKYTVMICKETGLRATKYCPDQVAVTYVRGQGPQAPAQYCNVHTGPRAAAAPVAKVKRNTTGHGIVLSICAETGKIATSHCPHVVRKRFMPGDEIPTETCPLHRGD